jgi:PhoH-like ATPase
MAEITTQYKVLDTNVFLTDPNALYAFQPDKRGVKNIAVIPLSVISELDRLKKEEQSEAGYNARKTIQKLTELLSKTKGSFKDGINISSNYEIMIMEGTGIAELSEEHRRMLDSKVDENILNIGLKLKNQGNNVEIITNDGTMQIVGNYLGLEISPWQDYTPIKSIDEVYRGWREIRCEGDIIEKFNHDLNLKLSPSDIGIKNPNPNEYFLIRSYKDKSLATEAKYKDKRLVHLENYLGHRSSDRIIPAGNFLQKFFMDALRDPDIDLVFAIGSAGTGKTLLSVEAAITQSIPFIRKKNPSGDNPLSTGLERFKKGLVSFEKILVLRPAIGIEKEEDPGSLPGDLKMKLSPWAKPVYDNLEFILDKLKVPVDEREEFFKRVDVESYFFLRGRNFRNAFYILDESQNVSIEKMRTAITRVCEGTKTVINGDLEQIDTRYGFQNNGLAFANQVHINDDRAATIFFPEEYTMRGERVKRSLKLMSPKFKKIK